MPAAVATFLAPFQERVVVLRRAARDADLQQPCTGEGARRLASEFHVGLIGHSRTARRRRVRASVLLSRWRHAADAAGRACDWSLGTVMHFAEFQWSGAIFDYLSLEASG